jgi:hypothetical protein
MEPKFQTSFIPKNPIVATQGPAITVVKSTSIVSFLAVLLFIATLIAFVGLFVYKGVLTQQIADADMSLVDARSNFEPEKIQELLDANTRIGSVTGLLDKHSIISPLLLSLQGSVIRRIRLTSFLYVHKDSKASVTLDMEAQGYNAMAGQEKDFSESEFFKNQFFSDFALTENGAVKVRFFANILPEFLSYKKQVEGKTEAPFPVSVNMN